MHPLQGFALKVNRAGQHLESLRTAIEAFVKSDFYETTTELDRTGRLVARVKNVKQPPPELAPLIGDAVHNLRSGLDNLAYALAAAHMGKLPDAVARTSAFPIFRTGPLFRGERGQGAARKIQGMSRSTRAAIERLQPYHHRKHPELETLWMLEELSNIDKHRLAPITSASVTGSSYRISGSGAFRIEGQEAIFGPLKDNAIVARFYGEFAPPPAVKVEANIIPNILFDKSIEAGSVRGLPVLDVLYTTREVVAKRVVSELSKELRRLFPVGRFVLHEGEDIPNHRRHDQRGYA